MEHNKEKRDLYTRIVHRDKEGERYKILLWIQKGHPSLSDSINIEIHLAQNKKAGSIDYITSMPQSLPYGPLTLC